MRVLSLYCGAGGIDEGLRQAGIHTTLAIDNCAEFPKQDPLQTIKLNHPDCETLCANVGDVKESLGKFDLVVGGPPCPEFSRAKTGRTFNACEVNNFWEIVESTKCKYHIMENVQDVIKVCKRRNFLVNCADYGVPQTRIRRIFTNLPLPKPTHSEFPTNTFSGECLKKWISIKDSIKVGGMILYKTQQVWKQKIPLYKTEKPHPTILTDNSDNGLWFVSPTGFSKRNAKESSISIESPIMTITNANEYQFTDKPVKSKKYIQFKNNYKVIRKLENDELAILQGFPTDYKFYGTKTSVRRQIGNAVPPPLIKAFGELIV